MGDNGAAAFALVAMMFFPVAALGQTAAASTVVGPPPVASPPPTAAPPQSQPVTPPPYRRGFLAMPFVGANLPLGKSSLGFDLGARVGGMVGWHVSPSLSLNGEVTADFLSPNDVQVGEAQSIVSYDVAFSPFFHLPLESGELLLGPKLGTFSYELSQHDFNGDLDLRQTKKGLVFGLNAGVFGDVAGTAAVGVLLSFTDQRSSKTCALPRGVAEQCSDATSDFLTLAVSLAALF
jgi:hypothetical protein